MSIVTATNFRNINSSTSTVDSTSYLYDVMYENWALPNTLVGGEKAMKAAARIYLPQEPMENDAQYENRLKRSTLKNFFNWAVENHKGRVFSRPIVLSENTDDLIKKYNEDLDLMGSNTTNFFSEVFKDMLVKGISFVYVDYPMSKEDLSLAEELESGFRPYCVHIKAEQVINAVPGMVNGRIVLKRLHIHEVVEVPSGEWGTAEVDQIRVLYPGYWELYRRSDKSNVWDVVDVGVTGLPYIPIVPLYGKKIGFYAGESPLQNLANLNRAHWQSMSDQMNITHVARVPILFGTGFDGEDSLSVGSNSAILGPTGSAMEYVEHTGKAIEAGMAELRDLEDRMMLESLEMLGDTGNTATGRALGVSDANSSLQALALKLEYMITQVNYFMMDWEGIKREGNAIVNTDFGLNLRDGSEGNLLLKMRQNKSISIEAFHREIKRRGILSQDFNSKDDISLLIKEQELELKSKPYVDENGKQIMGDENALDLDTGKPRIE